MDRRAVMPLTVRAVAIVTKWGRRSTIVKKDVAIGDRKVLPTMMARAVTAKKAADDGVQKARPQAMAHAAMPTKVLDACVEKAHRAVTAHPEMATKARDTGDQTAHRVATVRLQAMAPAASTVLTRLVPVPISHIRPAHPLQSQTRKRDTTSPTPSKPLSLAPGERVSWSQPTRSPGCFI
jgi:hypothetical protein